MSVSIGGLSGYRSDDEELLTGHWLRGELLGVPIVDRPALAEPITIEPDAHRVDRCLRVVRGAAFVRYVDIDWTDRTARVEIGLTEQAVADAKSVVDLATSHGFTVLNLRRLYGWLTPVAGAPTDALTACGYELEGVVPQAIWHDGGPVERQLWAVLRDA